MNPRSPHHILSSGRFRTPRRPQVISRSPYKCQSCRFQHTVTSESRLPRIAQPSFWQSLVPKFFRRSPSTPSAAPSPPRKKVRNPATYFIWIYILIGSQAVRIISLQHEHAAFSLRADQQIAKLREVVEKLQRGEEVDVEKVLGTGDPEQEAEWEQALKELEEEERAWQNARSLARDEKSRREAEERDASPVNTEMRGETAVKETEREKGEKQSSVPPPASTEIRPPGFF